VALAVLVPFLAACGGSKGDPRLEAFSQCMRSHGVSRFPDPRPNTGFASVVGPQVRSRVRPIVLRAAMHECVPLLPRTGWTAYAPLKP
jgi:hypothetical protein